MLLPPRRFQQLCILPPIQTGRLQWEHLVPLVGQVGGWNCLTKTASQLEVFLGQIPTLILSSSLLCPSANIPTVSKQGEETSEILGRFRKYPSPPPLP